MLKRLSEPRFATLRSPSKDAVALLEGLVKEINEPIVAEIGVGVGATSYALACLLNGNGRLDLFDYAQVLSTLKEEMDEENLSNVFYHPNGHKTFDSYNWTLVKILKSQRTEKLNGSYDLIYLDGAHAFQHDAPASIIIKELLKPNGIVLFDDFKWTFAGSPTANPSVSKYTADHYSEEQIIVPHIELVCELFFDHDKAFERIDLGYKDRELRRAYKKIATT